MQVLVHHDNHIHGGESFNYSVEAIILDNLKETHANIEQLDVFISDPNGPRHKEHDRVCKFKVKEHGKRAWYCESDGVNTLAAVSVNAKKLALHIRNSSAKNVTLRRRSAKKYQAASSFS